MSRRVAPAAAVSCAVVLTIALSACVPESAREQATANPTATGATSAASPSAAGSNPAPTATTSGPAVDPATCLAGAWSMDQSALERYYGDINTTMAGTGASFTPTGTASLTLTPAGAFIWTPSVALDAAVSGTTVLIDVGGSTEGVFTATTDRISTDPSSTNGLNVTATIDGAVVDPGPVARQISAAPLADASYTCTPDTLTLVSSVGGGTATSVLHR